MFSTVSFSLKIHPGISVPRRTALDEVKNMYTKWPISVHRSLSNGMLLMGHDKMLLITSN